MGRNFAWQVFDCKPFSTRRLVAFVEKSSLQRHLLGIFILWQKVKPNLSAHLVAMNKTHGLVFAPLALKGGLWNK